MTCKYIKTYNIKLAQLQPNVNTFFEILFKEKIRMSEKFMFLPISMIKQQSIEVVKKCNEYTLKYGLQLTDDEIHLLEEKRKEALVSNGRIEFMGGVLPKLIMEFADSPYLHKDTYMTTLMELQECFYYFKNESLEDIIDDELIRLMKEHFDHRCQGSLEYLRTTVLENICRDARYKSNEYSEQDGYNDTYKYFFEKYYNGATDEV